MLATNLQKGCWKLYQRQMAQALNESGQTLRAAVEAGKINLDVPWTEHSFEMIFTLSYLSRMYPDVASIKDLTTTEIHDLHEAVDHGVAQVFGVTMPFPNEESLSNA